MEDSNIYKRVKKLEQRVLELETRESVGTLGNFAILIIALIALFN